MLKRGNWSSEELIKLRETYGRRPLGQLSRELRRSKVAIVHRAKVIFSAAARPGKPNAEDEAVIREMVGITDVETMASVVKRRPGELTKLLQVWAHEERRGRFQTWELRYLKACFASRPDWAVALVLGRNTTVIRKRARGLCLGKDRRLESVSLGFLGDFIDKVPQPPIRMPRWTQDEIAVLSRLYANRSNLQLAQVLGRSVKSVIAKANEVGLRKTQARLEAMGRENVQVRHRRKR